MFARPCMMYLAPMVQHSAHSQDSGDVLFRVNEGEKEIISSIRDANLRFRRLEDILRFFHILSSELRMVHGPLHALFQCFCPPRAPIAHAQAVYADRSRPATYVRNLSDFEVASLENDGNADAEI